MQPIENSSRMIHFYPQLEYIYLRGGILFYLFIYLIWGGILVSIINSDQS